MLVSVEHNTGQHGVVPNVPFGSLSDEQLNFTDVWYQAADSIGQRNTS